MKFRRAGGKNRLEVEPGSTRMIINRPVWNSSFILFLTSLPYSNCWPLGIEHKN